MSPWFKWAGIAAGSTLVVVVGYVVYVVLVVLDNPFDNRAFDRELWMAYQQTVADNPRGEMYEDLVANHLRPGTRRDAVIALLGEPERLRSDGCLSYNLGMWSGFRADYDTLDICFDAAGTLHDARRIQH